MEMPFKILVGIVVILIVVIILLLVTSQWFNSGSTVTNDFFDWMSGTTKLK